jgi:sugar phosphate isomerase/epimerase
VHLGIKIGPGNWQDKLINDLNIRYVEVYLDLVALDAYPPLFAWLRDHGIEAGLHASTMLDGGLVPNLATADEEVRQASAALLRRIVDVAAINEMRFVVVHPGSYHSWAIREGRTYHVGERSPDHVGSAHAIEEMLRLAAYGRASDVEVWAENLPAYDYASYEPMDREHVIEVGFPPHTVLREVGERGVGLCVDIGHLYAEMAGHAPGQDCFAQVMAATRELVPYARHVHVSTTIPPWNGTDSHSGFLREDYDRGAVPSREQLLSWLRLFPRRDVWVIPEPYGESQVHLANYCALATWMEELG